MTEKKKNLKHMWALQRHATLRKQVGKRICQSSHNLKSLWCNGPVLIWKSAISGTIEHNFVFYVKFPFYQMFMEENFHPTNTLNSYYLVLQVKEVVFL